MLWKYRTGNKRKEYSMDKKFAVGIPITAFFLTFFVFFMINYICNTGILGEKTVLKWDATGQYINWMAYLWDILKGNTNELFYSISITPGNGNALLVGWYLLSPYNLILLLYDKTTLCDAYYWIEAAKICSSSFTMAIFLIRIAERKKVAMNLLKSSLVLVCCLGYSYGGFVAGHTHELLYFDSIIILPLLADSLIELKTYNKFLQYYLCLLYAIVTNFYFGVMMCIFSVLFYVYLSFRERFHLRNAIYYVITSFLATGTSLVVLFPIAYQIPLSKLSREETRLFSLTRWAFEFLVVLLIMGIIYGYYIVLRNEKYLAIVSGVKRYVADAALISVGGLALHYLLNNLGIKYLVSSNEISNNEYDLIDTVEDENSGIRYNLYLNKMSLPMAYHASLKALEIVDSSEGLEQAVELVNDYTSRNGDTGLLQLGFSTYVTDMEFCDNEIAVFSVPFEKGWYAYIDGEKANLEKAYGFFLAVKAPEGMHEIVIKYVPPYLKLGLVGSIISIIMFVFFLQTIERQRLKLNDE